MDDFGHRRRPIAVALWLMALASGIVSAQILLAPRSFYDDFPAGPGEWVSALPPYNEHLLRDFGAAGLGLTVMAVLAAVWMERRLVQAAAIASIAAVVPHVAYHLTTTGSYSTADNVASMAAFAFQLALPVAVLVMVVTVGRERSPAAVAEARR